MEKQRAYGPHHRMREIIIDNNLLLMAISRFDIAFGFGDGTIKEICEKHNVDVDTFLAVSNLLSGKPFSDFRISLPTLMGYLRHAHSSFVEFILPAIRRKLIEAINYSDTNDVAFLLMKFYDDYVVEVRRHMDYENEYIFSYVDKLLEGKIDEEFSISEFSLNHSHMASKLNELKDIFIYSYNQRDNDLLSSALHDIIGCERDLMAHFEVETNLFVPAVEDLEKRLRSQLAVMDSPRQQDESEKDSQLDSLSDREKDIIKCVAYGLSNKEIADKLCLSIHTITTHRRNLSAKLGIHSPAGLTIFAILHHLVELKDVNPHQ
ncbi:helix-turn-helix transcriptional regulator [uncultured Duncaniella sp.]|uniref:helix-turn-helix domain-containing protein n=2 Tax=uncultured Duncaniella sp. TaxID=2768039 RepID=UPI0026299B05|nr:helix-turn-helix transcriptional regulator [uncultured Duncaniella sp.]